MSTSKLFPAARLARWLLVLLLAFDFVASPLHAHLHDTGVDAHAVLVVHAGSADLALHAEEAPEKGLRHATLTARGDSRACVATPPDDATGGAGLPVSWPSDRLPAAPATADAGAAGFQQAVCVPDFPAHRSLPPAGRAPPRRA